MAAPIPSLVSSTTLELRAGQIVISARHPVHLSLVIFLNCSVAVRNNEGQFVEYTP